MIYQSAQLFNPCIAENARISRPAGTFSRFLRRIFPAHPYKSRTLEKVAFRISCIGKEIMHVESNPSGRVDRRRRRPCRH